MRHGHLTERRPGVWKYSYSIDGQRHYETLEAATKRLAEREAVKLYAAALDRVEAAQPRNWKVRDLLEAWLKDHLPELGSDYSRRNYREVVARFWLPLIGALPLAEYTSHHLLAIKQEQLGRLASKTLAQRWQVLRQAEAWGVKHHYLAESPAALVDVPAGVSAPVQRYSLRDMLALDAALEPPVGIVIALGLHAGLRIGEARALRLADVDALDNVLHVRMQLTKLPGQKGKLRLPKMGRGRTVEITPLLERHFELAAAWHEATGRPLLPGDYWGAHKLTHEPLKAQTVYDALRDAQARAGVPVLHFHSLRHTFATLAREAGILDVDIAASLGHANTNMLTALYGNHPNEDRHAGMRAKLAAYLGGTQTLPETLPQREAK